MDGEGGEQLNMVFLVVIKLNQWRREDLEVHSKNKRAAGDNISNDDITNMKQALKAM